MSKSIVFRILSLGFIMGLGVTSFLIFQSENNSFKIDTFWFRYIAISVSVVMLAVCYKNKHAALVAFFVLSFISGMWAIEKRLQKIILIDRNNIHVSGSAQIVKEPARKEKYQQLVIQFSQREDKILVRTGLYPEYLYGEEITARCDLSIPENFEDDFDYRMYLAKEGIFYLCQNASIESLRENSGNLIYKEILRIKSILESAINTLIPSPQSGLLGGLLLGGGDRLPKDAQENFSKTGLTHVVAVSGYNVTIVAEYLMIMGIFFGLWRNQAFWFSIAGIAIFVFMVGFPASAVRAGVMGALLLWATKHGRLANASNAILFSAVVMLLINPLLLRWDVGFQLSFLATLGIVRLYPLVEKYFASKNKLMGVIMETLFMTLCAQVFVLPVIFYNFHQLSLIAPLANVLVLPFIPLTMLLGFIMLILKLAIPPLAITFAWLSFLFLKYEIEIVNFLAELRFSSVQLGNFPWQGVVAWYIIIFGLIGFLENNSLGKKISNWHVK